ncbi:zinc fingers and homeoboxes protein 2 [Pelodytes ibericus]
MASKRKSTTPCMVRASELVDQEDNDLEGRDGGIPNVETKANWGEKERSSKDCEMVEDKPSLENQSKKLQGGYECKYCAFVTQNLNEFTEHVDLQHPNVILNPLYVCAECNFTTKKYDSLSDHNAKHHPGESNFKLKLMKRNNQTILVQSIEVDVLGSQEHFDHDDNPSGISISKMPIMKLGKARSDLKKGSRKNEEALHENQFNGSSCITETNGVLNDHHHHDVLTHVMPSVQLPPNVNLLPKVPVPLNSNKYNSALDTNLTLINSFNKFPYPTQAELSWLTAASKHPEEQIRIWFATQRLKHGISWSPEEVEEARKKMFNGTIQSMPQTITVLPGSLTTTAKISQPIIQTALPCQILGQTGLVLTQVTSTPTVTVPHFSANFSVANQSQKRPLQKTHEAPEPKRQNTTPSPSTPKASVLPAATTASNDRKKTKEQIAILKASFVISQFPDDAEIYRLIDVTGLSRSEIKKWFSDHRYRSQRGIVHITSESIARDRISVSRTGRGYNSYRELMPRKLTETTEEQLRCLENCFLKSSFPTQTEMDHLKAETKLNRKEIDLWFSERRKIRDSMEQAVLDSMGTEKTNDVGLLNGSSNQSSNLTSTWPNSTAQYKSKQEQLHLLKSTFARTQWPSPQEYDQLATQTGLVRTEIVKWFKDNRCVLRTGSLRWMEQYRKHYERAIEERKKFIKMVAATKVGKDILTRYFQEYSQLHEEDIELLVIKSKMNFDQVRAYIGEMQQQAFLDQSETSSQDGVLAESESRDKDWVKVSQGDEEAVSDGADSWGHAVSETPEETQDGDFGSAPSDNSHN